MLKCSEGVIAMADRLERYRDGSPDVEVRKIYRHPWGLIVGHGRGAVLTEAKAYLEDLIEDEAELSRQLVPWTPLDIITGTIAEAREAIDDDDQVEFFLSMPSELVPAAASRYRPNTHPLAVLISDGVSCYETPGRLVPPFEDTSDAWKAMVKWSQRYGGALLPRKTIEREVGRLLARHFDPERMTSRIDIVLHRGNGDIVDLEPMDLFP